MTNHTPTPWHSYGGIVFSGGRRQTKVCESLTQNCNANAAFIVKAVNCHEELVRACEMALDLMEDHCLGQFGTTPLIRAALTRVRDAA